MRSHPEAVSALLICCAAVMWGFDGVVLTPRLAGLPVLFVVFLLHAVPFTLLSTVSADSLRAVGRLDRRGWAALALASATGGLIGTLAIVQALFLVDFDRLSVVVLLQKLQPIFAIALAALVLKERVGRAFLGWAALAVAGATLLAFGLEPPRFDGDARTTLAAAWAVLAAAAFGVATVLGKSLLGRLHFRDATVGRYGVTSVLALLWLLAAGDGLPFADVTPIQWGLVVLIGLTTGSGAIFLYYRGLTRVRASVATICELCLPASAVLFDWIVNGSVLAPAQWLGATLLVVAILRISSTPRAPRGEAV